MISLTRTYTSKRDPPLSSVVILGSFHNNSFVAEGKFVDTHPVIV